MPPKGGTGMKWTTEEKFRLLITIIMKAEVKVSGAVMAAVAAEFGDGAMTVNALSKQFNAMKKEYGTSGAASVKEDPQTSTPLAAPATKKRGRTNKVAMEGKDIKPKEAMPNEESEPEEHRPKKKARGKAKGSQVEPVKIELASDD